jgi:hypothetical protein
VDCEQFIGPAVAQPVHRQAHRFHRLGKGSAGSAGAVAWERVSERWLRLKKSRCGWEARKQGNDKLTAMSFPVNTQGTTFPLWRSHSARTPRKGSASDPAPASQAEEGHSATQPEAAANSGDNSTSKRSSKQSHNKGAKGSTAAPSDGGGADGEARRAEELSRWKCLALWEREAPAMAATIIQVGWLCVDGGRRRRV